MTPRVLRTDNFIEEAAAFIRQKMRTAVAERGEFRLALSGGNTPRPVYQRLAAEPVLDWARLFFTFGDERCVPPEHERSNYRMARESLFLPAAVPERSIARMRGEIDPQLAAQEYEAQLNALAAKKGEMMFRHDLILLGMGDDGHTASLFPGTTALSEIARQVVANFVPKLDEWRVTFTFPLIARARAVCFLVDGSKHRELLEQVIGGDARYPAAQVTAEEVTWLIGEKK